MGLLRRGTRLALVAALTAMLAIEPYAAPVAYGQPIPQVICDMPATEAPRNIGAPGADGWTNEEEALNGLLETRRYLFSVKEKGTAYVYVGDQWYNLNLGVYSVVFGAQSCWSVQALGTSAAAERRVLQFVRPDERALEVEPGDYILSVRAGDAMGFDPSRNFTVRIAVAPKACNLEPGDVPTEYPGMTAKPENPNKFQVGISFTPDESALGPFTLMAFNAYVSPPYTNLFDFTWELDGQTVPGVDPTILKPYAELSKSTGGVHTVKLTARGARPYEDPTDPQYNFTPFDGGAVSVTCTFRGQS